MVSVVMSAFVVVAGPGKAQAQTAVVVEQMVARQQIETAPMPSYPIIAQAAKVTGAVNVDVTIAPDGRVVSAAPLGGPPMLQYAAQTGVRGWRFKPITSATGEPVTARTVISVLFGPQPVRGALEALVAFGDAALACLVAVEDGQSEAALPVCTKAVGLEAEVPPALTQGLQTKLLKGLVLSGGGRHDEALAVFSEAERGNLKGDWTPTDEALGHAIRARADRARGNLRDSAERYEDAYNLFDQVRRGSRDWPSRARGAAALQRRIGPEWADVLEQLSRQRDADRVRARVKALD